MEFVINNIEWISFTIALVALGTSYWFWKNPINTDFVSTSLIEDAQGNLKYVVGHDHKGWKVKRLNYDENGDLKTNIKSFATRRNNPQIKSPSLEIAELDKLSYN